MVQFVLSFKKDFYFASVEEKERSTFQSFVKNAGPGIITGASDDDPSGIATYSQAGALFGLSFLWTALLTFPLMAGIQEICARIGLVTKKGLAGTLKENYPRSLLILMIVFSFPAIVFNIGADIAAMGAVSSMLFPIIHPAIFSLFFTTVLMIAIIRFPYRKIASILKWLCISLFAYMLVPFFTRPDFSEVLYHSFIPKMELSKESIGMLVGILGTTISPYLFFWQTSMEVEENEGSLVMVDKKLIHSMRMDIYSGMFFSNLVMFFIILTSGTVLNPEGITTINTVDEAARALRPLVGNTAYLLFSIGIIGTGSLAIPVLAGSLSYMMAESFNWQEGLNKKYHEAKGFYRVIIISMVIALMINFIGISPVQSLLYTAILYGITAPVLIAIILMVSNNKAIMGNFTNSFRSNLAGVVTLLLMTAAAISLIFLQIY